MSLLLWSAAAAAKATAAPVAEVPAASAAAPPQTLAAVPVAVPSLAAQAKPGTSSAAVINKHFIHVNFSRMIKTFKWVGVSLKLIFLLNKVFFFFSL